MLLRFFIGLVGEHSKFSIHERILNMTLFVSTLFAILLAIQGWIEGLKMVLTIIVSLLASIFAVLYFFA